MLNLDEIDNFRLNFFKHKQNVDYLLSTYGTIICKEQLFLTIAQINDKYQYHTKLYHSVETFDDLFLTYESIHKTNARAKLEKTIDARNKLFNYVVKNEHCENIYLKKLFQIFDNDETFHLATLIFRFKKNSVDEIIKNQNNFYCFSEIYDIPKFEIYDEPILETLNDNPSHMRIIFKQNNDIQFYDPDICDDFHKIKYFFEFLLNDVKIYHYLKMYVPIQEITDDNYCLFHCIYMIKLVHNYDARDYNYIHHKIISHKFLMKKIISKLYKKILKYV
jgi:hypothetical protein